MNEITKLISELAIDEEKKQTILIMLGEKPAKPTNEVTVPLASKRADSEQRIEPEQPFDHTMTLHPQSAQSSNVVEDSVTQIGKYAVSTLLGTGGAGKVYRVRDPDLNRDIALKIPRAGILCTPLSRRITHPFKLKLEPIRHISQNSRRVFRARKRRHLIFVQ